MDEKKTLKSKNDDKKEDIKSKAAEMKDSVSEKGEEVKIKASEVKDSATDKGKEFRETASDKGKEFRETASEKTDELRTTAEKMVNDVLKTLREKQEDLGKTINDYTAPTTPYVDVIDTPTEFIIIADLPGVVKDKLSVDITEDSLTITTTFPEGREGEDVTYIKRERGSGEVSRTLKLTDEIKIKEASANFEDAILTVTLPKKIAVRQKLEIN
jgi:HSP20 family protein